MSVREARVIRLEWPDGRSFLMDVLPWPRVSSTPLQVWPETIGRLIVCYRVKAEWTEMSRQWDTTMLVPVSDRYPAGKSGAKAR